MEISAATSIPPIAPADNSVQGQAKAHEAATKAKAVDQTTTAPKVFTPAPPLRPNIQDFVDIDRTLISLREAGV